MNATRHTNPLNPSVYRSLPSAMFSEEPMLVSPQPVLVRLNQALLDQYGVASSWFEQEQALSYFAGNLIDELNPPVALAYSGHQFGGWSPLLGDGRAHMLGQLTDSDGTLIDVQTKGSGRTRFSRGGDGRATLASVMREYLISEAMAGLNIPTTRSLAMLTTGEQVMREQPAPGAILVRTAQSHIRVGSFQYAASLEDLDLVKALADLMLDHQFPGQLSREDQDTNNPYKSLLVTAIERQATLVSKWMLAGFIHGVMNTDNTSIIGETIDFGPCAFMDEFNANKVFSSIDRHGRYAWSQQGNIALWNLTRFAETLLPLLGSSQEKAMQIATECLEQFSELFSRQLNRGILQKLGLAGDSEVLGKFSAQTFSMLEQHQIDFTLFFDALTQRAEDADSEVILSVFPNQETGKHFMENWEALRQTHACTIQEMRSVNPALIARNHQVEKALEAATRNNDYSLFDRLCTALQNPYSVDDNNRDLQAAPRVEERVRQTFCGT